MQVTRGECKNVHVKHKTWLNVLFTVCDGPIKTRLTPVKVVRLVWWTSLQTSARATSRRWETSCFTFLWNIRIWKLRPFYRDQLITTGIADLFHPWVRLPSPCNCASGKFCHFGPEWGWNAARLFGADYSSIRCPNSFPSMAQSFPEINGLRHIITIK